MILEGISVKGSYHDINQDSFRIKRLKKGFVAALSDGLGSKRFSHYGSRAICESAVEAAESCDDELMDIDPVEFVGRVHECWLKMINGYKISDCYATLLVFVIYAVKGFAVRLGDGFIGLWADDQIKILFDKKDDYFANETDCVTENLLYDKMEIYEFEISELRGGVLCSDGIGIGNMAAEDLLSFTRDFVDGYGGMSAEEISGDIRAWLRGWPGSDDKTLTFFIAERI